MAEFNRDHLQELIKLLKESVDIFEAFEKQLDDVADLHIKRRTAKTVEEENRKNILLAAIRRDAMNEFRTQMADLTDKFHNGEIDSEERFIEQQAELWEEFLENTRDRADKSIEIIEKTYERRASLEEQYKEVSDNIAKLEAGINADKDNRAAYQKQLNDEIVRQHYLEVQLYDEKKRQERELANFQKTLLKELEKERIEQLREIEEERIEIIEQGLISEEEANARARGRINVLNEAHEAAKETIENPGSSLASTIGDKIGGELGEKLGAALGSLGKLFDSKLATVINVLSSIRSMQSEQVTSAMRIVQQYIGPINTRLQGTDLNFKDLLETMQENLTTSAYVNQKEYISNLATLVDKGIAYNVEERALWMTIGDKIATTFNSLEGSLTRLIRLQQADLTRSSLGTEASITTVLNTLFNDTSYMSNIYDDVSNAILESTSQMNIDQATSFTYAVQKWLGALYSVGMSDQAVRTIAEGINLISTGDVSSLSSNTDLQTLMALSASRSGRSLTSMMTNGMYAEDVDDLMKSMIEYLASIAENTSSQVVKSQWADIVNLSISDLRAISNLSSADISALYNTNNLNYASASAEVENQLSYMHERTTIQERLDNFISNIGVTYGMNIADNDLQYIAFMLPDYIDSIKNKLGLSGVGGWALTVLDWVFEGISAVANAGAIVETVSDFAESLKNGVFGVSLDSWNSTAFNRSRGSEFLGLTGTNISSLTSGVLDSYKVNNPLVSSVSSSTTVGSSLTSTLVPNFESRQAQIEAAGSEYISSAQEASDTMEKLYSALFEDQVTPIKVKIDSGSDEFFASLGNILETNLDELSQNFDRSLNTSSLSVQNLTTALYNIRSL